MALGINIVSGFDGRGIEKALKEFAKLETVGEKAQFAIQKAALPAAAALAGLGFAAVKATQAAMQEQQEMATLASTLQRVTGASQETIDANEKFLASMQRATIYSDSDMRPALASLVQASGDLGRSQQDLQLAMDIATATGVPLVQVADALGKAYNDNFKSLKALSPALNDNIKEGQSLDAIFQELTDTFGGATAAATDTAAGKMKQLQNQMADLQESIGMTLLPVVERIVPIFASLANAVSENQTTFLVIVGAIAAFSAAIIAASTVIKVHTTYQKLMKIETLANSAAFKSATGAAVGFTSALGGLLIAQTLAPLINNVTGATGRAEAAFQKTGAALNEFNNQTGNSEQVLREFINTAQAELRKFDPSAAFDALTFKNFGREFELVAGDIKLDIEVVDETFRKFAETSPEYAQSIVNAMKAQLAITDPASRAYKDLQDAVARYEAQLRTARGAQDALNGAIASTPRVIPLTGALARLESQTQREFIARQTSANALDAWNQKATQAFNAASKGADKVKTAKEKLSEFTDALRSNYDAQRSLGSAQSSRINAEKGLQDAIENTRKAQEQFNFVTKGFPQTSEEAIDATNKYATAQRKLRDANIRVSDAAFNVTKAEQKLAEVRAKAPDPEKIASLTRRLRDANLQQRDAVLSVADAEKKLAELRAKTADPQDVAEAESDLQRSKYGVEEANFRVADAEAKLAELRADPKASPIELRRAEIDLAQAKLGVGDAVRAVSDAEKKLSEQRNMAATPREIADAERDLERAKFGVQDAIAAVTEAEVELAKERAVAPKPEDIAEAERDLAKAKMDVVDATDDLKVATLEESVAQAFLNRILNGATSDTKEYKDALKDLNDAKDDEADQRRNVASALLEEASATIALRDAIVALSKVTASTPANIVNRGTAQLAGISTDNPALGLLNPSGTMENTNINVTVNAGMGTNGDDVARQIIDVLKSYERTNGYVPLVAEYVAYS